EPRAIRLTRVTVVPNLPCSTSTESTSARMISSPRPRPYGRDSRQRPLSATITRTSVSSRSQWTAKVASSTPYACSIALLAASEAASVIPNRSSSSTPWLASQRPPERQRLDRQQRDVVLERGLVEQRVVDAVGERAVLGGGWLRGGFPQPLEPLLDRLATALDEAVGVEHER